MRSSKGDFSDGGDTGDLGDEPKLTVCRNGFKFVREVGGTEADRETDLLSGGFISESRRLGGMGGGGGFFIESFRVVGGENDEGEVNAIVFRLDFKEVGIIDDGRDVGTSSPADRCLTRCIAIVNSSRSMKPRSKVLRPLGGFIRLQLQERKKEKERTKSDLDLQQAPYRPKQTRQKRLVRNNPCCSHPISESGVQT